MIAYGATLAAARAQAIEEIEAWLVALDGSDNMDLRNASLPVYQTVWYSV